VFSNAKSALAKFIR